MVSFSDVADHLFDFAERYPAHADTIDSLAAFLVAVEAIPHDHRVDPDRGLSMVFLGEARRETA